MPAITTAIEDLKTTLKVGLEVHVELATRTKMWTSAPNVAHPDYFDAQPNTLLDPIVIGMPGTLPVMNRAALEMSIKVGLALGCRIAPRCKWDRKGYYYPDLPKNYQISQYDLPLCGAGAVEAPVSDDPEAPLHTVRIIRAHLEEDAGKLLHEAPGGRPIDHSIIDLNRAGTPLLEIVTEPDFTSAEQVVAFGRMLRNICRFLGVSEGIMQRGHMRFEPNINVLIEPPTSHPGHGRTFTTPIVEIKNLNSFKALRGAIEHEHRRQVEQWLADGRVMGPGAKSTRGWDDAKMVTLPQRDKEDAHDYRYFPDPDLVPVTVSDADLHRLRAQVPELPLARERRYVEQLGLSVADARSITAERDLCLFFESLLGAGLDPKRAAAVLRNNLARLANERGVLPSDLPITAPQVAAIERLRAEAKISSNAADQLYALCSDPTADGQADPAKLAERHGLIQVSAGDELDQWIDAAIAAEPKAAEDLRQGKAAAIGRLTGAAMKLSKGQANPKIVQQKLREKLQR